MRRLALSMQKEPEQEIRMGDGLRPMTLLYEVVAMKVSKIILKHCLLTSPTLDCAYSITHEHSTADVTSTGDSQKGTLVLSAESSDTTVR